MHALPAVAHPDAAAPHGVQHAAAPPKAGMPTVLNAPGGRVVAYGVVEHAGSMDGDVGEADFKPKTDLAGFEAVHEAYLKKSGLQLERPEFNEPPPEIKPVPGWLRAIGAFLDALGPLFQILFIAMLVAIIGGFLYFVFGEAVRVRFGGKRLKKDKSEDDVLPDIRPDAQAALSLLEEADALARAGRFAEAVHLLLFRSIEDIQGRLEGGVPHSLTAREIGGLRQLPERAKRALGPIIRIVEHSFFGGRDVDEGNWQTARQSYEQFAFGEGWA